MAVNKLPCLSPAYPLFDWKTWPDSEAALVQGGSTRKFQISCWNAIVVELENAIIASGGTWNTLYTTASEAKIDKDGRLFADKFNSLTKNIDEIVPLRWQWAANPNFRGYIERQYFRGASDDFENPDKLYPEYIKELVRRMNLVIEIMKGDSTDLKEIAEDCFSITERYADFSTQPSLSLENNAKTLTILAPETTAEKPSAPTDGEYNTCVVFKATDIAVQPSRPFIAEAKSTIKSTEPDAFAVPPADIRPIILEAKSTIKSTRPEIIATPKVDVRPVDVDGGSASAAKWEHARNPSRAVYLIGKKYTSIADGSLSPRPALSVETIESAFSIISDDSVANDLSLSVEPGAFSETRIWDASIECNRGLAVEPALFSETKIGEAGIDCNRGLAVEHEERVKSTTDSGSVVGRASPAKLERRIQTKYLCHIDPLLYSDVILSYLQKAEIEADVDRIKAGDCAPNSYNIPAKSSASVSYVVYAYFNAEQSSPMADSVNAETGCCAAIEANGNTPVKYTASINWGGTREIGASLEIPLKQQILAARLMRLPLCKIEHLAKAPHSVEAEGSKRKKEAGDVSYGISLLYTQQGVSREIAHAKPSVSLIDVGSDVEHSNARPSAIDGRNISCLKSSVRLDGDLRPLQSDVNSVNAKIYSSAQVGTVIPQGKLSACEIAPVEIYAELVTAWLPPIWVDDGLHIRQVHDDPILNDNGELVIT